jgi:DNA-binding NarL/FixJ family response regulator
LTVESAPHPIKAAICDPQTLLRPAVEQILKSAGMDVLWSVSSLSEIPPLSEERRPDALLLNCTDPTPEFLRQVGAFQAVNPSVKIVAMSDHGDDVCVLFPEGRTREGCVPGKVCCLQQALGAGARGAVRKTESPEEVVRVIRQVCEGRVSANEPTLSLLRANGCEIPAP